MESQWPSKLVQSARQDEFVNLIEFWQCPGYSASQTELEPRITDTAVAINIGTLTCNLYEMVLICLLKTPVP